MSLCGKCLHARSSHTPENGHLMLCASCGKLCGKDEYEQNYTSSFSVVHDGVVYKLK